MMPEPIPDGLARLCGGYLHQDWDLAAVDLASAVRSFALDGSDDPQRALWDIDVLLAGDLTEDELGSLVHDAMHCGYNVLHAHPGFRAWLHDVRGFIVAARTEAGLDSCPLPPTTPSREGPYPEQGVRTPLLVSWHDSTVSIVHDDPELFRSPLLASLSIARSVKGLRQILSMTMDRYDVTVTDGDPVTIVVGHATSDRDRPTT
jgi:hypothetical protein